MHNVTALLHNIYIGCFSIDSILISIVSFTFSLFLFNSTIGYIHYPFLSFPVIVQVNFRKNLSNVLSMKNKTLALHSKKLHLNVIAIILNIVCHQLNQCYNDSFAHMNGTLYIGQRTWQTFSIQIVEWISN